MANRERYKQYIIPENVSDGGKVKGFAKRNVFEGCVLAGIGFLMVLPFRLSGTTFISTTIFVCVPLLGVGAIGVQGDPLSVFLRNMISWFKHRGPVLFNNTPRVLEESPVDVALTDNALKSMVSDKLDAMAKKVMEKDDSGKVLVEGIDFEFAPDQDETDLLAEKQEAPEEVVFEELPDEENFVVAPSEDNFLTVSAAEPTVKTPRLKARADLDNPETEDLF